MILIVLFYAHEFAMLYAGTSSGFLSSKNLALIRMAVRHSVSSVDPSTVVDRPDGQALQDD